MQRPAADTRPALARRLHAAGEALEIAPTHIVALLILASCACAGLLLLWWTARPVAAPARAGAAAPASAGTAALPTTPADVGGPSAPPEQVVIHVSGAVADPGVRTLPGGARVDDAVQAAGGATSVARTDQLNLARPLRDGEQIHVPDASEAAVAAAGADPAALVNLNRATAAELEELPGVGPVLAERIIAHRERQGGFRNVADLQQVSGIGEKIFAELEDLVTV